jgi:hypothetical protein
MCIENAFSTVVYKYGFSELLPFRLKAVFFFSFSVKSEKLRLSATLRAAGTCRD